MHVLDRHLCSRSLVIDGHHLATTC
jgi:hypothetical protein